MNKTININLGGLFFHIDEKAFLKLKHYLDAISNSLNDDPQGKEEIINDIEQRISELLSEKIKDEREVINESYIDEVIAVMGQPEDYAYDGEMFNETENIRRISKKMYRDGRDKILGGVSSGLGHYFGIDTAWVRIIWILITLLFGTGILVYIVLWIILPEANTTSEELEMKGEPVNINNIERSIKDEYSKLEERVRNADYTKVKSGLQDFIETLGRILLAFFKVLGMIIGVLILIIAATTLIGLIIGFFSWGSIELLGIGEGIVHVPPFFEFSLIPEWLLTIMMFLAILIPFIFLFIIGLNILSKDKKSLGLTANLSLLGVWIVSLIGLGFAGIEHENRFATKASITENYEYTISNQDTLSIVMHGNDKITNRKSLYRSSRLEKVEDSLGGEKLYSSYVHLDVRRSSTDEIMVKVIKTARSFNYNKAKDKANSINYFYSDDDNTLNLDAYFLTSSDLEHNKPKIDVIVYVPENQYVFLDHTTKSFIHDIKNTKDLYDAKMANHHFIMSTDGFECIDCKTKKRKTHKKDKDKENDSDEDLNLKIDNKGVKISIDNGQKKVDVKIDENGIEIK